ncbi:hypothetical protein [Enterococcus sp. AZ072]|uniref:hypothetical protein n=1 Tax=unclassified Enterococcus TaxID=2608891 RepID=UPI003D2C385E
MDVLYILFLATGVSGLMQYFLEKGYIKSIKSALLASSLIIVTINTLGNPQALVNGHLLNTLFSLILSSAVFGICMISLQYLTPNKKQ